MRGRVPSPEMPSQSSDTQNPNVLKHVEEGLKVLNCLNCRRRKVRCDRRQPCSSCVRNKADCVFPVSGRPPRRIHNAILPKPPPQRQAVLFGQLQRLEGMVSDLTSQIKQATARSPNPAQERRPTSAVSSSTSRLDHLLALRGESARGDSSATPGGVETGPSRTNDSSESPQTSREFDDLVVDNNGDVVVGTQFWTVFCKEVSSFYAMFCLSWPCITQPSPSQPVNPLLARLQNGLLSLDTHPVSRSYVYR